MILKFGEEDNIALLQVNILALFDFFVAFSTSVESVCPRGVAEALLIFLEALPEPLVPAEMQPACIQVAGSGQSSRDVSSEFM